MAASSASTNDGVLEAAPLATMTLIDGVSGLIGGGSW